MSDELPPPENLIVWYRPLGKPLPCLELDAWPWTWLPRWGWTPIAGNARAAADALLERLRRARPGQYLITPDDVPLAPPDEWPLPGSLWPFLEVRPKVKKPKRPLSEKQKAKQAEAFARVDGSTNLASRTPQPDTSTTDSPPHEMP